MNSYSRYAHVALTWLAGTLVLVQGASPTTALKLKLRSREHEAGSESFRLIERVEEWEPAKTCLIICDMWDQHWCKSAARRVAELAGPLNEVVKAARVRGVFIIHAPSTCMAFYENTPQRTRARSAPYHKPSAPLATEQRWGTAWCWTDPRHEAVLPIDDSDMGCDCQPVKCTIAAPWTRQIDSIEIADPDAITDAGQETWNLLEERGITNVILCGVHLNMCVLGRPFAIRQQVKLGRRTALMRDLTDTMYNPERPPGVSHFAGTDLVIEHVEKYWCRFDLLCAGRLVGTDAGWIEYTPPQEPGGPIRLSWPRGYKLQRTSQLAPPAWEDAAAESPVERPTLQPAEYFRAVMTP